MRYNVREYSVSDSGKHLVSSRYVKDPAKVSLSKFTHWVEVYRAEDMELINSYHAYAQNVHSYKL
jgi:hypothetical protein